MYFAPTAAAALRSTILGSTAARTSFSFVRNFSHTPPDPDTKPHIPTPKDQSSPKSSTHQASLNSIHHATVSTPEPKMTTHLTSVPPQSLSLSSVFTSENYIRLVGIGTVLAAMPIPDPLMVYGKMAIGFGAGAGVTKLLGRYTAFLTEILNSSQKIDSGRLLLELRQKAEDSKTSMQEWEKLFSNFEISPERFAVLEKSINTLAKTRGVLFCTQGVVRSHVETLVHALALPDVFVTPATGLVMGLLEFAGFGVVDGKMGIQSLGQELYILRFEAAFKSSDSSIDAEKLYRELNAIRSIQERPNTLKEEMSAIPLDKITKILREKGNPPEQVAKMLAAWSTFVESVPEMLPDPKPLEALGEILRGGTFVLTRDGISQAASASFIKSKPKASDNPEALIEQPGLAASALAEKLLVYAVSIMATNAPNRAVIETRRAGDDFGWKDFVKNAKRLAKEKLEFRILLTLVSLALIVVTRSILTEVFEDAVKAHRKKSPEESPKT